MRAVVDTGPLVAFLDRAERHHRWVGERIKQIAPPLLVCEPVLTEAMFLLGPYPRAQEALFELLKNGALHLAFEIDQHIEPLQRLLQKYHDVPMSLADACVVRMSEIHERHAVLTLDADFSVYRKHGRVPLVLIAPEAK
jgi:predicted nucleic acid-binding protein